MAKVRAAPTAASRAATCTACSRATNTAHAISAALGAAPSALCYDESMQTALDALADGLESALDIDRLFAAGRTAAL